MNSGFTGNFNQGMHGLPPQQNQQPTQQGTFSQPFQGPGSSGGGMVGRMQGMSGQNPGAYMGNQVPQNQYPATSRYGTLYISLLRIQSNYMTASSTDLTAWMEEWGTWEEQLG